MICGMHITVRALSVWHILILPLLITIIVLGSYGALIYYDSMLAFAFYLFFGSLLATLLYTMFTSTLLITENEIRFGWWHIGSARLEKVRLRLNGWILDLGRYNWVIVLDRDRLTAHLAELKMSKSINKN